MRRKRIELKMQDRALLERFCTTGVHSVRLVNRAKIILALDEAGSRLAEKQEVYQLSLENQNVKILKFTKWNMQYLYIYRPPWMLALEFVEKPDFGPGHYPLENFAVRLWTF